MILKLMLKLFWHTWIKVCTSCRSDIIFSVILKKLTVDFIAGFPLYILQHLLLPKELEIVTRCIEILTPLHIREGTDWIRDQRFVKISMRSDRMPVARLLPCNPALFIKYTFSENPPTNDVFWKAQGLNLLLSKLCHAMWWDPGISKSYICS